jgi:hypothetical protein
MRPFEWVYYLGWSHYHKLFQDETPGMYVKRVTGRLKCFRNMMKKISGIPKDITIKRREYFVIDGQMLLELVEPERTGTRDFPTVYAIMRAPWGLFLWELEYHQSSKQSFARNTLLSDCTAKNGTDFINTKFLTK